MQGQGRLNPSINLASWSRQDKVSMRLGKRQSHHLNSFNKFKADTEGGESRNATC
jgi:hypothetical protein